MTLRFESLEARDCPATFADVAHRWPADHLATVFGADPGVEVLLAGVKMGDGPTDPIYDVYAAAFGGGPRVVARDPMTGTNVADFFAFEESFRGGISSLAVVGTTLYASPGDGGGPVVCAIDLVTQSVRRFPVAFPADWRGGLQLVEADIDFRQGGSAHPAEELLILPGGDRGGRHLLAVDAATGDTRLSLAFGPAGDRGSWQFVGASAGVLGSSGVPVVLLEPKGTTYDPVTHTAPLTVRLELVPGGTWAETHWDTSKPGGSADGFGEVYEPWLTGGVAV